MTTRNHLQMQLMDHSPMSPSSLGKLSKCSEFVSGPSTADAKRGTMLHKVMETGEGYEDLNEFDRSQIDIAHERVNSLCDLYLHKSPDELEDLREQKLDTEIDDVWGTLDRVFIDLEAKQILAIDYKFGMLQVEPVRSNFQSLCYSLALFRKYPFIKEVSFAFVHPALGNDTGINAGVFTRDEVKIMHNMIDLEVKDVKFKKKVNPHPSACKYCDKLIICQAVRDKVETLFFNNDGEIEITGRMVDAAKIALERSKKIIEMARWEMIDGKEVDGYYLKETNRTKCQVTLGDVQDSDLTLNIDSIREIPMKLKDLGNIIEQDKKCTMSYFREKGLITTEKSYTMTASK